MAESSKQRRCPPRNRTYNLERQEDLDEVVRLLQNSDIEDLSSDGDDLDVSWKPPTGDLQSSSESDPEPDEPIVLPAPTQQEKKDRPEKWKRKQFVGKDHPQPPDYENVQNPPDIGSPLMYFEQYYPDSFFDDAADFTNRYYMAKTGRGLGATAREIKQLYGMHVIMGCIPYPRIRMYWKNGIQLDYIFSTMRRDRFFQLRNNLHFVDTVTIPEGSETNRLWKVQPVIDAVRKTCLKIPRESSLYSVDEKMIPFTGRCSLKQYVKGKPRPVGLKNFVITTSQGLVVDFEIYQGKETPLPDTTLGLGPAVVLRLVQTLPPASFVYFDRYFTTIPLLEKLRELNLEGTGTIMVNRLKNVAFTLDSKMKRGDMEEYCLGDRIALLKWRDNKSVVLASTCCGSDPVEPVERWCKSNKTTINVQSPAVVRMYNKNMGGVDTCDQLMECYRTFIKTRKWTLKVILYFLDLALVNSWMQYRDDCKKNKVKNKSIMDLLGFRLTIGELLVAAPKRRPDTSSKRGSNISVESESSEEEESCETTKKAKKVYKTAKIPPADFRLDGFDHWPVVDKLNSARFCRRKGCSLRTRTRCEKCNVYLCLTKDKNCFKTFHTSQ